MTDLPYRALIFATKAHDSINQRRKYSGAPYIVHPIEVASIVASVLHSEEQLVVAYLHDVIEDVYPERPEFSPERIQREFGEGNYGGVDALTDKFTKEAYPELNRKARKVREAERLGGVEPKWKTVKLADLIANTGSIVENDKGFARTYLREKREMLHFLKGGDGYLLERAWATLEMGEAQL
jgi:guanosine-3',5'-bis(diphosphate) 3'-pyrophosphohydrolase